jgi:hypothetical protein
MRIVTDTSSILIIGWVYYNCCLQLLIPVVGIGQKILPTSGYIQARY